MTVTEAVAGALTVTAFVATFLAIIFAMITTDMRRGLVRDRMALAGWLAVTVAVVLFVSAAWVGFMGSIQ